MQRTTVFLPVGLKTRAEELAKRRGMSLAGLIRDALVREIKDKEGSSRDPLLDEALQFSGKGPHDTARRADKYLYGRRS